MVIRKEGAPAAEENMEPALQNVLLITEGNNVNQAPQGKEFDLLSESSRTQKAPLSGTRDGGQAIQKEEDPQGKRLKGRGFRPVSQWCHCLAWTLCLLLSLSCLVLSAVLGTR